MKGSIFFFRCLRLGGDTVWACTIPLPRQLAAAATTTIITTSLVLKRNVGIDS